MSVVNAAQAAVKTVGDPNALYESMVKIWEKNRAVCNGERFVKGYDRIIDPTNYGNLLIPFSPTMSQDQYNFYKAEAELPGITAEFSKMIVGGLLRKSPTLTFPDSVPPEAADWILNEFGKDDCSLTAFMDRALWEEVQTTRSWLFVDYPVIENYDALSQEERDMLKPYPVLQKAEAIINWRTRETLFGRIMLDRVIVRGFMEVFDRNEFHADYVDTVWVHELDDDGYYQIRIFQRMIDTSTVQVNSGVMQTDNAKYIFELVDLNTNILMNGERIPFIPAWPLNGTVDITNPILSPIIDKELSLYNKLSRRNHLLYGASTYTPIISSDMGDEEFDEIVNSGLGTWIKLRQGDTATVLETPTAALADMEAAIAATIEEMAKLGIRMLAPETTDQSGVALELRNASQTAQLGSLNNKISATMRQVIAFMVSWRYELDLKATDITFALSEDFNSTPLGEGWLRLATEWYDTGKIPRSVWLRLLKQNDIIPPEYDDETGREEITKDMQDSQALQDQGNFYDKTQQGANNA